VLPAALAEAPIDNHRDLRLLRVVATQALEQLPLELPWNDAVVHRAHLCASLPASSALDVCRRKLATKLVVLVSLPALTDDSIFEVTSNRYHAAPHDGDLDERIAPSARACTFGAPSECSTPRWSLRARWR